MAGAVATFPLFVPPFFLPLYSSSLGLSASTGAGLVAGFNLCSAFGRLGFGFLCDKAGPINSLFLSLFLSAISMLVLWPISTSLGPLVVFTVLNGAANGGFFAVMPTVVGAVFGSLLMTVAMGMVVTAWAGGYLMVSVSLSISKRMHAYDDVNVSCRDLRLRGTCWKRMEAKRPDYKPITLLYSMQGHWRWGAQVWLQGFVSSSVPISSCGFDSRGVICECECIT